MTTIIDEYIKRHKQLVIAIAGSIGTGKTKISKEFQDISKLQIVFLNDFAKENYDSTIKLSDDIEIINYDSYNYYDWDKFNKFINDNKKNGIIICGVGFPKTHVAFVIDFHIYLKLNKQHLLENKIKYLETHNIKDINIEHEKLIVNKLSYPHILNIIGNSVINKFINVSEYHDKEKLFDDIFDSIINFIENDLYKQ